MLFGVCVCLLVVGFVSCLYLLLFRWFGFRGVFVFALHFSVFWVNYAAFWLGFTVPLWFASFVLFVCFTCDGFILVFGFV